MPAESVPNASTPNGLNATSNASNEQAESRKVAGAQSAGPQASQSDNKYFSTRLRSKKGSHQKSLTPSKDFTSPRMVINLMPREPLTRKRQWHEAKPTEY